MLELPDLQVRGQRESSCCCFGEKESGVLKSGTHQGPWHHFLLDPQGWTDLVLLCTRGPAGWQSTPPLSSLQLCSPQEAQRAEEETRVQSPAAAGVGQLQNVLSLEGPSSWCIFSWLWFSAVPDIKATIDYKFQSFAVLSFKCCALSIQRILKKKKKNPPTSTKKWHNSFQH